ncbi:hypothetical protein LXM94_12605, partial [Rhizobium sp. TRM95111]|uniref:hypothetical protein n=1 Tax=Rhizobium alarense TaxID=2846851 RepID=UPI001F28F5CA
AARLRLKYPDFAMPADLYAPATPQADESGLWTLYEQDAFAAIDAEIVRRKTEEPDWEPTADFSAKLARRKARFEMTAAAAKKDWIGVIAAGKALDAETEREVDLLWLLIDAYAASGDKEHLAGVYRGILFRQGDARLPDSDLLTTMQKATRDFPADDVRKAAAMLGPSTILTAGMHDVELDLIRREISDFNGDGTRTGPLPAERVERLRRAAVEDASPRDLSLLGWYDLKRKEPAAAETAFAVALGKQKDPDNAKGLYLSLAAQKKEAAAYAVAAAHLDDLAGDPEFLMNALSIRFSKPDQPDADEKTVGAYSTTILQTKNADHAEILAWYAYNSRQYEAARAWFEKAIDWESAPARIKGLALSLQRLGLKAEFAQVRDDYRDIYPEIWTDIQTAKAPTGSRSVAVEKPRAAVDAGYLTSFKAKRYGDCLRQLSGIEAKGRLTADANLIKGWCLLGLDRISEARAAFTASLGMNGRGGEDAAYGAALTMLRGRLTDDAEALIGLYPLSAARDREVRAEIHWQRARSAFDNKQYQRTLDALNARAAIVAEPSDMSQLRGWAHYKLGHKREANAVFERLNAHLYDPKAAAGLAEINRIRTGSR